MNANRVHRVLLSIEPDGGEYVSNVERFAFEGGQAQIHASDHSWTLHLIGDPAEWHTLAEAIHSAAGQLEGQGVACRHRECSARTLTPNAAGWAFDLCPTHLAGGSKDGAA